MEDVPAAQVGSATVTIRTSLSLVSIGTERMLIEFGKAGLLAKARHQPEKVRQVVDKVRTDGLVATLEAVRAKLDQPMPMGYCNVGTVLELGRDVVGLRIGDRVASNGKHAEIVSVPRNLCARVPDCVSDEAASFTVLGAIALQGLRLAAPTLGEAVVVTGLGLIGLIAVQLLRAQGCRVLGLDFEADRLELARQFGAEVVDLKSGADPVAAAQAFSRGRGVDAVIITASTQSNEPVHQAAQMCRKRGRIVLVGVVGLELSRADFFEKELTFQVSCSYGPGRHDTQYEEQGHDYPVGFVRWTAQRNFEAVLDMLAAGSLNVEPLISHRFPFERAPEAYELIARSAPCLGVVLQYPADTRPLEEVMRRTVRVNPEVARAATTPSRAVMGFIGAGNYAGQILIPAFRRAGAILRTVASNQGVSSVHAARKNGIELATTDTQALLADGEINAVVIATRHNTHASYVIEALSAGKHVFVEKPLALTLEELSTIVTARETARTAAGESPLVMVGFNRRFAPQVVKIKSLLAGRPGLKSFVMTVNAGAIPPEHWTQDRAVGGGRILGEACHFIDLLRHLAGSRIVNVRAAAMGGETAIRDDKAHILLEFEDGSTGAIHYLANGHRSFPKERLEVFCDGSILQLENFRRLHGYGWRGFSRMNLWRQDKGQRACAEAFVRAIENGTASPIPFAELVEVAESTIAVAEMLRT